MAELISSLFKLYWYTISFILKYLYNYAYKNQINRINTKVKNKWERKVIEFTIFILKLSIL